MNNNYDINQILYECFETLGLVIEYDLADHPTHQHAIRVGEGCVIIGDKLGLSPRKIQQLYFAGLLHDIGKISLDINLLKKKEKLTDSEFQLIRYHSVMGCKIAAMLPELSDIAFWIRWHHEKWDGTGYPDKLYKDQIPVEVQILSTMDCFDSMQTPRFDRDKLSMEESYNIIKSERDTSFNPVIVDLICDMIEKKEITPGKSSDKFIELKQKYLKTPIIVNNDNSWSVIGMTGIYPILRLFARVIDAKHSYTHGHSTRVSILSKYLAGIAGFSQRDLLKVEVAGLLHDAGKISIPLEILNKNNLPDNNEWEIIKNHPVYSSNLLKSISLIKDIADITQQHHERLDGSGYPCGSRESEIDILAQIIAISDTFDAMTSERTYRGKVTAEAAYKEIKKGFGYLYNKELGEILIKTPPVYIKALFDMHLL
jgi:HD-GYP domain-containing protein (c-di-GMP phosphodiesterase class II)